MQSLWYNFCGIRIILLENSELLDVFNTIYL